MPPTRSSLLPPSEADPLQRFQDLMPHRVRRLLLVASLYDSFLLEEGGHTYDLFTTEVLDSQLNNPPRIVRVPTGAEAMAALEREPFDIIVASTRLGDMEALDFARLAHERFATIPLVILAFDDFELRQLREAKTPPNVERLFVWQGDFRVLLAVVKTVEDRMNVEHDTNLVGVSSIIVVEDDPYDYSAFVSVLYAEIRKQASRVFVAGINPTNKLMRMRARPKILLCSSFEEALERYRRYERTVLGVITDVGFSREGRHDPMAGLSFAELVHDEDSELPVLVQTRDPKAAERARSLGVRVISKSSPTWLQELVKFAIESFGFGDFVFARPDGTRVARARDLRTLEQMLHVIGDDSLLHHARKNHFSTWLRARTEFQLAEELRPRKVSGFESTAELRRWLIDTIHAFRRERQASFVATFDQKLYMPRASFAQIGEGSLGGKARSLAFVRKLLSTYGIRNRFPNVRVFVPSAIVIAADAFDRFLTQNHLLDFALREVDDREIEQRFIEAEFPKNVRQQLREYVDVVNYPLSVRSSSLLEDSQYQPFAGVYATYMVPNNHPDRDVRLRDLFVAIKRVYASTFSQRAKSYIQSTPHRIEEEKMAVIVQRLVGSPHGSCFYPTLSGVARSYNFYPIPPMKAEDGIVTAAMGLGRAVEEGIRVVRFSPHHPQHLAPSSGPGDVLRNAQTHFYALGLEHEDRTVTGPKPDLRRCEVASALEHGTLEPIASVYSPDDDRLHDGLGRPGAPVVTLAPILKHGVFPLAEITSLLLEVGAASLNRPVEIEFAVNLGGDRGYDEFAFLQMRPFVLSREAEHLKIEAVDPESILCRSNSVLGNGRVEDVRHVVVVDRGSFDRSRTREVAQRIAEVNARLGTRGLQYLLIGVGRWGASDPWLGIPVTWDQIAGACAIVEQSFEDFHVAPSQGTHFFQNLTAAMVGYFTIDESDGGGFVDWDWLSSCDGERIGSFVRHIEFDRPLHVCMDGREGRGVILKPQ